MTASLQASAYLVDSVDLATATAKLTHDGAGLYSGLTENLSSSSFPGVDRGEIDGGVFPPFTHSTMYLIRGTGHDDVWAKVVALRRRCKPGRTVTLTRQMPDPDGTPANTNHTTTARRVTDRIEWFGDTAAAVDIDWWVVDAPWHGSSVAIPSAAGTQSILGDTRTNRMTLTLAAGAARTVANSTNGYSFTFGTTVPTGGVLIDVEARTATAITGGADYSAYLSWTKTLPFQLEQGSNVLTVSAGSASISYQPAYL